MDPIIDVKRQYEDSLLAEPGIVLVGVTERNGVPTIRVGLEDEAATQSVPQTLGGHPVEMTTVGSYELLGMQHAPEIQTTPDDHQSRHRPVLGGVSAIHFSSSACTTGFVLQDDNGTDYLSSNNHCFALLNQANIGDPIIQPSPYDGGSTGGDEIGTLHDYVPIDFGGKNPVDVGWIEPEVEISTELYGIGELDGWLRDPEPGDTLTKTGRTTAVTQGNVEAIDVTVNVRAGSNVVTFTELIESTVPVSGGDSGSPTVMVGEDFIHPVGLVFASGSTTLHIAGTNIERETGMTIKTASSIHPSDIVITGCATDARQYGPGGDVELDVTIENRNNEESAAFSTLIMLGENTGNIRDTLGPGESKTYPVNATAPETIDTHDIMVDVVEVAPTLADLGSIHYHR